MYMFVLLIVGVGSFVAGMLVYRKNAKRFEADYKALKSTSDFAWAKVKNLESELDLIKKSIGGVK